MWKERDTSVASVLDEYDPARVEKWNRAEAVPSEIHVELMKKGKIPDPYIGANEHKVQCGSRRFRFDEVWLDHFAQGLESVNGSMRQLLNTRRMIYLMRLLYLKD